MKAIRVLFIVAFILSIGSYPAAVAAQTAVPAGVVINSATLSIYVSGGSAQQVSAHRITGVWDETDATWNNFHGAYDAAVLDSFTSSVGWKTLNIRSLVQGWVDGSIPNRGVLLANDTPAGNLDWITTFYSSENTNPENRPRLKICYTAADSSEVCTTVRRAGAEATGVLDTSIRSDTPDTNYGTQTVLYARNNARQVNQTLLRFDIPIDSFKPGVNIVKYTNGVIANDPNGMDVPLLKPGEPVVWTYRITNTGETSVPRAQVSVTDNQPGVTPAFAKEVTGDGDTAFEPGEVWEYTALGLAVNLGNPPDRVITVANACTRGGTLPGRTAYVNQGKVTIPGVTDTADSSYCNKPGVTIVKYTNGILASDPNGADVPQLHPGDAVVWTYRITNTGQTSIPREQVSVTDNQPGITPAFAKEVTGDGDTVFEPGEVWDYSASGVAVDLENPPAEVITIPNACTLEGTQPGRTAYVNQGTVTIPEGTDTANSSYCTASDYKVYIPAIFKSFQPPIEPGEFEVTVGFEDLPLTRDGNDFDYNDWVVNIKFTVWRLASNPDLIQKISFDFTPRARGSVFSHTFFIVLPANTFPTRGSSSLSLYDGSKHLLKETNGDFIGTGRSVFEVFPKTTDVYPANYSNTFETKPRVRAQRTASLTIDFDTPVRFLASDFSFVDPHGAGLFFEPMIRVINNGEVIGRHDIRMLTVPQNVSSNEPAYRWPEEYKRIDKVYPKTKYIPGDPPDIRFEENWWLEHNNCAIDGHICR